jgi:hypothetical protein
MARWWIVAARAALVAVALTRPPAGAAQDSRVAVHRIGAARHAVESGAQATLTFRVSNLLADEQRIQGRLDLPPGWQLVIPEPPATLPGHGEELRLLRIALPASARAGAYTLLYGIGRTKARDSVVVVVPQRRRIVAMLRHAPGFVPAGTTYDVLFAVRNTGNESTTVHLALSRSDDLPMRLDSTVVHVEAGDERVVRAQVQSGERMTRTISQRIRLIATVERDTARVEPAVSVVEVIPRGTESASRFRRVPSALTIRQVDRAQRPTVELRGAGALTSSGATTADYLLRGPSQTASLSGELDEYRLSLSGPRYRLLLGDRTAAYSRLGESWRSGFGAEGELSAGGIAVGGFAQRDRRSPAAARDAERGAKVDVRTMDGLLTGVRYLSRSGASAADVWTAHGLLTRWRAAAVDVQYARGRDSSAQHGNAYAVALTGAFPRGSYGLRRLAADSTFPGLTRGNETAEAVATIVPLSGLTLSLTATDWTARRAFALTSRVAERQRAVDGRITWTQWLEAGYRRSTESRLVIATPLARRTESIRLSLGVPLGIASVRGGIEKGVSTFENAPGDHVPFRRLTLRGTVGRGENLLAASVEWLTGMPTTLWFVDDRLSAALTASVRVTPSTLLSTSVNMTRRGGERARMPMVVDVGLVQKLPFGQQASWRTRAMSYGPGAPPVRPTHQADYTIPLGLPVGLSSESGVVQARLVDRDAGRPLAGVLVRLGDQAHFTDSDGLVSYGGLTEATHYLQVDRASLGPDRIIVPAAPLGVRVHAGETTRLELGVVRGARVEGSVRRFELATSSSGGGPARLDDAGASGGAVVQLASETDTLRASADAWGHFTFGELAPGRWMLSVVHAELPRYHRFERQQSALELRPGESLAVVLRVIPSAPPVQIIAQAELTLEPATSARGAHGTPRAGMLGHAAQWQAGRRRVVPAQDGPVTADDTLASSNGLPWLTGRRRYVPAPARTDSGRTTPPTTRHRYTVTRWDISLVHVARVMYDDASLWPKIWLANLDQVKDPDVIRAGQRLRVPDKAPLTAEERAAGARYMAAHPH